MNQICNYFTAVHSAGITNLLYKTVKYSANILSFSFSNN